MTKLGNSISSTLVIAVFLILASFFLLIIGVLGSGLTLVVVSLFLVFLTSGIVLALKRNALKIVGKKAISLFVIAVFSTWFIGVSIMPLGWFLEIPTITYSTVGYFSIPSGTVTMAYETRFTTKGSFSVNNPIDVEIFTGVWNASFGRDNATDWLNWLGGIGYGFTNAVNYDTKSIQMGLMNTSLISLRLLTDGPAKDSFYGHGTIIYLIDGPSYGPLFYTTRFGEFFSPQIIYSNGTNQYSGNPILNIASVSDTLAPLYSQSTFKLAWQLGAFSAVLLQPLLEAFLPEKRTKDTKPTMNTEQLETNQMDT